MKNILLFVYAIYLALTSCNKDWLEIKANKTQSLPNTLADFQAMLDYTPTMNNYDPGLGEIASDGHYIREQTWQGTVTDLQRNAYTWSNNYPYTHLLYDWNYPYSKVLNCNIVL